MFIPRFRDVSIIVSIIFTLLYSPDIYAEVCGKITGGGTNFPEPESIGEQHCDLSGPDTLAPGESANYTDPDGNTKRFTMPQDGCNCGTHIVHVGSYQREVRSTYGYWKTIEKGGYGCGCGGLGHENIEIIMGGTRIISTTYRAECQSHMTACGGATFPIYYPSPYGDQLCQDYGVYCGYDGWDTVYEWVCSNPNECNKPNYGPPKCPNSNS